MPSSSLVKVIVIIIIIIIVQDNFLQFVGVLFFQMLFLLVIKYKTIEGYYELQL